MRLSRLAITALAILFLASCKIRIIVPEGGSVTTSSGAYSCSAGKTCDVDVLDFFFDETFIAKPAAGYNFKYWRKGDRRFCGGDSKPCSLYTGAFKGDWIPIINKFLESDEVFYLQPVFDCDENQDCFTFVKTGEPEVVFDWSTDRCEIEDVPDVPARAFRDASGKIQLIASHFINRRMIGSSLSNLVRECDIIMASHKDSDPSKYNDREWLMALYTIDGIKIHALVHNEYQGNTHAGKCPSGDYFSCWYNSITYASSEDMGRTYTHATAPDHLVASVPYKYVPDQGPYGFFEGSNIVHHELDGFYYRLLHLEARGKQEYGVGVMRTKFLSKPASWRCWDGKGFNASLVNPYRDVGFNPAHHVCAPVSRDNINKMAHSLTYNTFLGKYLLVGAELGFDQNGKWTEGIFYSLTDDFVHWSKRKLLMEANGGHGTGVTGDWFVYPSIIDPDDGSRNFEYSDQDMYLYLTRWQGGDPYDRDLVRIPLEIKLNSNLHSFDPTTPEGSLDVVDCNQIAGWSWDPGEPNKPLQVAIYDVNSEGKETLVTSTTANIYRVDLKDALKGNGVHGFDIPTPAKLRDGRPHTIRAYGVNPDPKLPAGVLFPEVVPLECN